MSDFQLGDRVVPRRDLAEDDSYRDWHSHFGEGVIVPLPSRYDTGVRGGLPKVERVGVRFDGKDYNLENSPENCHTCPPHVLAYVIGEDEVQAAIQSILKGVQ